MPSLWAHNFSGEFHTCGFMWSALRVGAAALSWMTSALVASLDFGRPLPCFAVLCCSAVAPLRNMMHLLLGSRLGRCRSVPRVEHFDDVNGYELGIVQIAVFPH